MHLITVPITNKQVSSNSHKMTPGPPICSATYVKATRGVVLAACDVVGTLTDGEVTWGGVSSATTVFVGVSDVTSDLSAEVDAGG